MLHYNLYALHKILNALSILTQSAVTMYDRDFKQIPSSPFTYMEFKKNHFCNCIKKHFHDRCLESDHKAFNGFVENVNFYYYHCHCGLIEIACRIYSGDTLLGYILIGPFRDESNAEYVEAAVKKLNEETPLNCAAMMENYKEIPPFSEKIFTAIQDVFKPLLDYIELKNYLSKKEDFFSLNVEPYVLANLSADLSIDFLCKHFYVSRKTLYKVFQENTGATPLEYITKMRVEYAKKLIVSTDLTLTKIAERVGIPDYNYFIKVFKSIDGNTPSYYRKSK